MTQLNQDNRRPPGPDTPQALGINPETLQTLVELRDQFGNVVSMQKPNGRDAVFINDIDAVRQLLVRHHGRYKKGPGFERVKMLLGNGLIVSDGNIWRRSRRMIQPAFSRQNLHQLIDLMVERTRCIANRWDAVAQSGEALNISAQTSEFALDLILRCIFGKDYEALLASGQRNPFAFLAEESERDLRVVLQAREAREKVLDIIRSRRNNAARESDREQAFDFLSMYMSATDKSGASFDDDELLDEVITLIIAGYETSAGTLNWAWFLLATHPGSEQKLLEESRVCLPSGNADDGEIDAEAITAMVYAQQVLDETLRLYPPVWLFTRRSLETDSLQEYAIGEGTDIYLSPYVLQRSACYWTDPDTFNPDRFGEGATHKRGDRPYFPFSLGPRRCLGEYFSFLEMKIHLGLLIQRFRMTLASDSSPELDLGINLRSKNDIVLIPERRQSH